MSNRNDLLLDFRLAVMEQHLGLYGVVLRQHGEIIAEHRWRVDEDVHLSYPNSYRLDGLYGQYSIVFPEKDAVVTITAHQEGNQSVILDLVWDTIADRL